MKTNDFRRNYNYQRAVWHAPKALVIDIGKPYAKQHECIAVGRKIDDDSLYVLVRSRTTNQWLPAYEVLSPQELRKWMGSTIPQ